MSTYSDTVLQDTPALYWSLGESSGTTANDLSPNNRDGTYVNAPTFGVAGPLTGDPSTAVGLNGTNEYITSTYDPFVNGRTTSFEGWFYRTSSAGYDCLFAGSGASGAECFLDTGSQDFELYPGGASGATWAAAWPGNAQWVYWALTFEEAANTNALYINGSLVSSKANSVAWDTGLTLVLGAWGSGPTDYWLGSAAHFAVYEFGLSAARIKHHWNVGKGRIGVDYQRRPRVVGRSVSNAVYS